MPSGERGAAKAGRGDARGSAAAVAAPDPNAALARTRLARQRSALTLAAVAGLLVHEGRLLGVVSGLLIGALAASTWFRRIGLGELTAMTLLAAIAAAAVTVGL